MRTPLSIGVVGLGQRGLALSRVFDDLPEAHVRWVCDHSAEVRLRLGGRFPAAHATSEVKDLLDDEGLDALVVATPPPTRYELCRSAIECDKHVFVASPFARRGEQARDLVRRAEEHGRSLVVGDPMVFHPGIQKLRHLVATRRLGELYHLHAERHELRLSSTSPGPLWSLGADLVAAVVHLLADEPVAVTVRSESYVSPPTPDVVFAHLAFATGISVQLHVSCLDPVRASRLTLVGSKRMAVFDELDAANALTIHEKSVSTGPAAGTLEARLRLGPTTSPNLVGMQPLVAACRHFVSAARSGEDGLATAHTGAIGVSVLEALEESVGTLDTAPEASRHAVAVPDSRVVRLPVAPA